MRFDHAAGGVGAQLLLEVADHLRRREAAQGGDVLTAVGALDLVEVALERLEVVRLHLDRLRAGAARNAAAHRVHAAGHTAQATRNAAHRRIRLLAGAGVRRVAGHGGLRALLPAAEEAHREHDHQREQADLKDQAEERGDAAQPPEKPAPRRAPIKPAPSRPAMKPPPKRGRLGAAMPGLVMPGLGLVCERCIGAPIVPGEVAVPAGGA